MLTIEANGKQTLKDIAMQDYGNYDAIGELLSLNPELVEVTRPFAAGIEIVIDETSPLRNEAELKRMADEGKATGTKEVSAGTSVNWHAASANYFERVEAAGKPMLYRDMLAVDRLFRDLYGEPTNAGYDTYNQHTRLKDGAMYPWISGDETAKGINMWDSQFQMTIGFAQNKRYYSPLGPSTSSYKVGACEYETDFQSTNFSCGVFCLTPAAGNLIGVADNPPFDAGFVLKIRPVGRLIFAPTGFNGSTTYAIDNSFGSQAGFFVGDSYGGDVSVWHDGHARAQALYDSGYVPLALSPVRVGSVSNYTNDQADNNISFVFMADGYGNSAQGILELKALNNAVYYYLYQRGVLKTFTPFV